MKNFSEKSKRRNIKKAKKSPFRLRQGGISAAREGRKGNPLRGRKKTAACLKGPAEAIGQHRIDGAAEESCFAGRAGFLRVRSGSSRSAPGVWGDARRPPSTAPAAPARRRADAGPRSADGAAQRPDRSVQVAARFYRRDIVGRAAPGQPAPRREPNSNAAEAPSSGR